MKKVNLRRSVAVLMVLALTLSLLAGCGSKPAPAPAPAPEKTEEPAAVAGGWMVNTEFGEADIPEEALTAFNNAMGDSVGAGFEPVALLGTQVVAGMNYSFLCKTTLVTAEPVTKLCVVTVYHAIDGSDYLLGIDDVFIEDYANCDGNIQFNPADMVGGWNYGAACGGAIDGTVQKVFDKAMDGFVGVGYEPIAVLGSQVVAGANYAVLCKATAVTANPVTALAVVTVYADLNDGAEILSICGFDKCAEADVEFSGTYEPPFAYSGISYTDGNEDYITVEPIGDGTYSVWLSIYRLTQFEGVGEMVEDRLEFRVGDPNDGGIVGLFYPAGNGTYTVSIEESDWNLLEAGTYFEGFDTEPANYEGLYEDDNYDDIKIVYGGMGMFDIEFGIYRLSTFVGGGKMHGAALEFRVTAPDGSDMYGSFFPEPSDEETYVLTITDSSWDLLESGTVFSGFKYVGNVADL